MGEHGILYTIVIGLVVGAVAKFIMPGAQGGGLIVTTLLGIVGALVATFGGQFLGLYPSASSAGFIASVVGALVVLIVYGMLKKKS